MASPVHPQAQNRDATVNGMYTITGKEAADLFCQAAFRRSRGNGAKMRELLEEVARLLPRGGGGFLVTGQECHPSVPGCNFYMAKFQEDFLRTLAEHAAAVRAG